MSQVDVEADFFGKFDKNSLQIQHQEQENDFKTVQLVDGISVVYKNGNFEKQDQEDKISMARENPEDSITKFYPKFTFQSDTEAEKEKREMKNKILKIGVILFLCFLLLNFVFVAIVMNRTSETSSSLSILTRDFSNLAKQMHKTGENFDEIKSELKGLQKWKKSMEENFESFQMQSLLNQSKIEKQLKVLENSNNRELKDLKNSYEEIIKQFESLNEKFDQLESNISSYHVSPATLPENEDEEPIEPQLLQNCGEAMEILPSPRANQQAIHPHGNNNKVEALCDFETDGGGWTIIQKRSNGPKYEFKRNWTEYTKGFGSLNGNFWLGLDNIHSLTQNGDQELRIELEDFEGEKKWAKYSNFSISDASDLYRLAISGFYENSTAGDSMTSVNQGASDILDGMRFSTIDQDNDKYSAGNCAHHHGEGGWWFNACSLSGLNGLYFEQGETVPIYKGIYWYIWKGTQLSLAKSEMKIRTRKAKTQAESQAEF